MNYKRFHLFEKTQVLVAGGGLLAVVFFLLGGFFRPADPLGPLAMLPNGNLAKLLLTGALLLVLALITGALTTHSRPEGGLLTALVALGGLALLSEPIDTLLWCYGAPRSGLYGQLILEVLLLGVGVTLAEWIVTLVRASLAKANPAWVWADPLDQITDEHRKILRDSRVHLRWDGDILEGNPLLLSPGVRNTLIGNVGALLRGRKDVRVARHHVAAKAFRRGAACLLLGVVAGVVLVSLLMQSDQRGQILFSLFAGFALAAMAAQHVFPTRAMFVAWLMPIATAVVFYLLAALTRGAIRPQYEALPIDWISAGCSGARPILQCVWNDLLIVTDTVCLTSVCLRARPRQALSSPMHWRGSTQKVETIAGMIRSDRRARLTIEENSTNQHESDPFRVHTAVVHKHTM